MARRPRLALPRTPLRGGPRVGRQVPSPRAADVRPLGRLPPLPAVGGGAVPGRRVSGGGRDGRWRGCCGGGRVAATTAAAAAAVAGQSQPGWRLPAARVARVEWVDAHDRQRGGALLGRWHGGYWGRPVFRRRCCRWGARQQRRLGRRSGPRWRRSLATAVGARPACGRLRGRGCRRLGVRRAGPAAAVAQVGRRDRRRHPCRRRRAGRHRHRGGGRHRHRRRGGGPGRHCLGAAGGRPHDGAAAPALRGRHV